MRLLLLPVAFAFAVAGCDLADDGPRTTQTRDLPEFTRVDNRDEVDVRLRVGDEQRVVVRAGEKVIDDVVTEVRDGTLRVSFDRNRFLGDDLVVEASVPALGEIAVGGSGDVSAEGIDAEALTVRSDGSGDITLDGRAGRLDVELDGSGDVDLERLTAHVGRVKADGSGDADVRVARRLEVTLDGSGDVRYRGNPQLTEHVDGSGDLKQSS